MKNKIEAVETAKGKIKKVVETVKSKSTKLIFTAYTTFAMISSSLIPASATNAAPSGVDSADYQTIVNIVFWIVVAAIGAAALPALQSIVKGQTDGDDRQRNSGIVACVVAGCCIGAATAIKNICF